jgi:RNA-directed DNA polymerase
MGSLLDRILEWENIQRAMKRVYANKGASGVDGMKVEELNLYMSDH